MTNLSAETALLNALRIENKTETRYLLMEAVNLGTVSVPNWYHLGTTGSWETKEDVRDVINSIQSQRPDSVFAIMCEVSSTQVAQALAL